MHSIYREENEQLISIQFVFLQPHNAHFHNRTMHIFTTAQFVFSQPRNSHFHNRTMRIFTTGEVWDPKVYQNNSGGVSVYHDFRTWL